MVECFNNDFSYIDNSMVYVMGEECLGDGREMFR